MTGIVSKTFQDRIDHISHTEVCVLWTIWNCFKRNRTVIALRHWVMDRLISTKWIRTVIICTVQRVSCLAFFSGVTRAVCKGVDEGTMPTVTNSKRMRAMVVPSPLNASSSARSKSEAVESCLTRLRKKNRSRQDSVLLCFCVPLPIFSGLYNNMYINFSSWGSSSKK